MLPLLVFNEKKGGTIVSVGAKNNYVGCEKGRKEQSEEREEKVQEGR